MSVRTQDCEIIAFVCLAVIFETWERLRPARSIDRWHDLKTDLLSFVFALVVNRICTYSLSSFCHQAAPAFVLASLHRVQALPSLLKILIALLVVDFVIYWIHRAQHRFDCFWRTHAWHHSIERLYWFSGFRTSFLHSLIYNIPQVVIPILVFKLSPAEAAIGYSIGVLIQFWEHTNVTVNIGSLSWLLITPDYHRVHHSTAHCHSNFGTTFSLRDRIFGTYLDPATVPVTSPLGLGQDVEYKNIPRMLMGV